MRAVTRAARSTATRCGTAPIAARSLRRVVWHVPAARFDVPAMAAAAGAARSASTTLRAFQAHRQRGADDRAAHLAVDARGRSGLPARYLRYQVTGTGFLRHMVRNIVGFLR